MKAYNLKTALQTPNKVTELYIYNRGLTTIPEAVFVLSNLKVLSLRKNNLKDISNQIARLNQLETIDLSENNFLEIPDIVFELANLRSLNFNKNQLDSISEKIAQLKHLEKFYATHNQISKLPQSLFGVTLTTVDLSDNQIEKIPASIRKSKRLNSLNFQENRLSQLPDNLIECTNLQVLEISNNRIRFFPKCFAKLSTLYQINLNNNKLEKLPEDIGQCFSLRKLSLENNRLESIPKSIAQLKWLSHLALKKNEISKLPTDIGRLQNLQKLFLASNPIRELPESFFDLERLSHLTLTDKYLVKFNPTFFLKLRRLKILRGAGAIFSREEKSRFLSFLKYARKVKLEENRYEILYCLLVKQKRLTKKMLINALHFPMQKIRINAQDQLYDLHNARKPVSSRSILHFSGRSIPERKKYKVLFESLGIKCVDKEMATTASHIVLGDYPDQQILWTLNEPTFIFERDLIRMLKEKMKENYTVFSQEELKNLSSLLLSAQPDSIGLAIEILKTAIIPVSILTDLFIVYKTDSKGSHRESMKKLLIQNASYEVEKKLRLRLPLSKRVAGLESLKRSIEKYTEGTELIKRRFYELLEIEEAE